MELRDANLSQEDINILRDVLLGNPKGKDALKLLLGDLGYFSPADSDENRILKNYATRLVSLVGPSDSDLLASAMVNAIDTSYTMEYKSSKKENN
jgi:hypothetical protein